MRATPAVGVWGRGRGEGGTMDKEERRGRTCFFYRAILYDPRCIGTTQNAA